MFRRKHISQDGSRPNEESKRRYKQTRTSNQYQIIKTFSLYHPILCEHQSKSLQKN